MDAHKEVEAYPLCWPSGWKRSAGSERRDARFHKHGNPLSAYQGVQRVLQELSTLGVKDQRLVIISTNLHLHSYGWPRANQPEPKDPGVAVYWTFPSGSKAMAVDRYNRVADNLAAIAKTLEALATIERHGGGAIVDRAFQGFVALPAPKNWRDVMGFPPVGFGTPTSTELRVRYLHRAKKQHPDNGGSHEAMQELNEAYDKAREELRRGQSDNHES